MRARVTPVEGRKVLDPNTLRDLAPEGLEVEWTAHWQQRSLEGDVTVELLPARDEGRHEPPQIPAIS